MKNPKRVKLKPCPFDGGKPQWKPAPKGAVLPFAIECCTCHASTAWCRMQIYAVIAWNERTK